MSNNNKKVLKDIEDHLEGIASSIFDVAEKCPWVTGYEEEAVNMSTSLKTIAELCEDNNDKDECSLQTSLKSISRCFTDVGPDDICNISTSLQSISDSLGSLVSLKREKRERKNALIYNPTSLAGLIALRKQKNGLNYSPSPKHSKYLKRSMIKTADGRKKLGKVAFSRTGKRLFIRNRHDYTSE